RLFIGAAVAIRPLREQPQYHDTLVREFNVVTPENVMKFSLIHPERDRYDFTDADAVVNVARTHGMQVRGHTLVWHQQMPEWLSSIAKDEVKAVLQDHITTVVSHYRGQVAAWDVVNEAIADDSSLRNSFWLQSLGADYIDWAFQWAHSADPEARLVYNDYGAEGLNSKSDAVYAFVQGLLQRNVPIHGVGLQMHVSLADFPAPADVTANVRRLVNLGLAVDITEMDVRLKEPATASDRVRQGQVYQQLLAACLAGGGCQTTVLWGFTDRHSWVPSFFPGWGSALIFDQNYRPKPAYYALQRYLASPLLQ
ncbi:MAG: endo-1,4-beta-xylanase, partial [Cyanobacteria bacterium]|nr:endo-1,4-beta-xylanase [Cyanobacteriota bacterium]